MNGQIQNSWEEISIDIEWGTLRGKKIGSGERKILAVHGWMDNANSFDLLAPYITNGNTIISVDLPGHGQSDHFPSGFIYDKKGYIAAIKKLVLKLEFSSFTYLGHSIGAIIGIMYAAVFPEDINSLISIDIIKPWSLKSEDYASNIRKYMEDYFKNEKYMRSEPLEYKEEELIKKIILNSDSLNDECAKILMERNTKLSECETKIILTRDLRAKVYFIGFISHDVWLEFAKKIKCPILILKAKNGRSYCTLEENEEMLKAFEEESSLYEYKEVEGEHHIHLTHASAVGPIVKDFLVRSIL